MVTFKGYEQVIEKVYAHKQEHVFEYWNSLLESEKKELLDDLADIDYDLIKQLYSSTHDGRITDFRPAPFIKLPSTASEHEKFRQARLTYAPVKSQPFLLPEARVHALDTTAQRENFPWGRFRAKLSSTFIRKK
jgi:hypothetical protein